MFPAASSGGGAARRPRRRRRRRSARRGVALVMVLGALTILTIMLTEFQDETAADLASALSYRDGLKAEYAARSAINLTRLFIASEPTIRGALGPILMMMMGGDSPQIPVWEFADQVLGAFNDEAGAEKFSRLAGVQLHEGENLGLEGAGFDIVIIDEDSKINLNTAFRDPLTQNRLAAELLGLFGPPQFDPLFQRRDRDGQFTDRRTLCAAIIDWVDADTTQHPCDPHGGTPPGAAPEDSFYQLLEPRYERKNAPFDSLEELRLVRGVGDDVWATFIDPDPASPNKRNVTVWGQGKVNVNTANAQTLHAIICGGTQGARMCLDPQEAAKFYGLMSVVRSFTAGVPIFGSPKGFVNTLAQRSQLGQMLAALQLEPINFLSPNQVMAAITTESKVFSIIATGYVRFAKRETRVRIHSVVDFRGAPAPPNLMAAMMAAEAQGGMAGGQGMMPGTAPGMMPQGPLPPGATQDAFMGALQPSPGGRVIYYRID